MKKIISQILLVLIFSFSVSAQSVKTYKIGCIKDYYPYISVNNSGELEGIIIDWWNLLSEKTGVEFEYIPLDIQSCIEKTTSGEIDGIAGLFYSDERTEFLDFSEPLMRMRTVLFLENGLKFDSIANISATISIVENSLSHLYLIDKYPHLKLNVLKDNSLLINSIYQQKIEAFIYDVPNPAGNYKFANSPKGYTEFETLFTERLRSAVKKGNSELFNLIISGVAKISDEELTEIVVKWELFQKDRTQLWVISGVGFVLLLVIVFLIIAMIRNKKKNRMLSDFESGTDWQLIINKGENDLIEFKSSLRWDYRQEKVNKELETVIVKTISAFLNAEGGMLFIGVDDDGNILGLENDYQSLSKRNKDGFMLTLTNLVNQNLGKSTHKFVNLNIISINEKDVCIVGAEKSDKPIFFGKNEKEEFYIRASASSQPLGMRETFKYIKSHWG